MKNLRKLIAHRGNIIGPNIDEENKPEYLIKTINKGFFVELDLWVVNNKLYLGHDNPQYIIDYSFLSEYKDNSDECVLTSKGYIWTYPGKTLTDKSICVMPERTVNTDNLNICAGICTDYVLEYCLY